MERKQHWEQVYRDRQPTDVSWFQPRPEISLDLISACGVGHDQAVIDIGGGASRLVDCLLDAGYFDVSVLDIAAGALAHARQRLGEAGRAVHWLESDITRFVPERHHSIWHDRAVFHFLTEAADRQAYRNCLGQGLVPGGHLIIATFALDGPTMCSNLPVQRYSPETLSAEMGDSFVLQETRTEMHLTPAGKEQRFVYCRFRKR